MSHVQSVKDICQKIWELEKEFDLLDFEIQGVKIWQFLRMNIYYEIAQKTGVFSLHTSPENRPTHLSYKLQRLFNSLITLNPLLDHTQRDVLVFPHVRKVTVENQTVDIYTRYLIDEFKAQGVNYQAYERTFENRLFTQEEGPRRHFEIIEIVLNYYRKFCKVNLSSDELEKIQGINERINKDFNVRMDLRQKFSAELPRFQISSWIFKRVLQNKKPKKIFLIVNYGWMAPLIKAAKDLKIETIELQHGTFSDYHLGYSFPNTNKEVAYFPSQFWVWKDFWKGMSKLPIKDSDIADYSFKYFDHERQKFVDSKKASDQIVVISQGAIGYKLAEAVLANMDRLTRYKVKYKLHPGEYGSWEHNPHLVKLKQLPNVEILADNKIPLYQLLAESKYLVGVFSTAVFEGLDFGCELILMDLPGIEYMKNLIDQGKAKLIKDGDWIASCVA
ncbi:MAG: hypothetical protein H6754_06360 [Candidatus Omnitrophica bacterium]|nr:hypothetical protein [Candidatus Omnitrophota bacterium]